MKKILFILALLACFFASAQTDTTKFYKSFDYGWRHSRVKVTHALILPGDTTVNKIPGSIAVIGGVLYIKGDHWGEVSGGGSFLAGNGLLLSGVTFQADTALLSTKANRDKLRDSLGTAFIQNQSASNQSASFKISGTGYTLGDFTTGGVLYANRFIGSTVGTGKFIDFNPLSGGLDFYMSVSSGFRFYNSSGINYLESINGSSGFSFGTQTGEPIYFRIGSTVGLTVAADGSTLIGNGATTNGTGKLQVYGGPISWPLVNGFFSGQDGDTYYDSSAKNYVGYRNNVRDTFLMKSDVPGLDISAVDTIYTDFPVYVKTGDYDTLAVNTGDNGLALKSWVRDTLSVFTGSTTIQTLTDGATITWDYSDGPNAEVTLGGNRTLSITNASEGQVGIIAITQDETGGRTITVTDGTVTLDQTAGATTVIGFYYDGSTFYWNGGYQNPVIDIYRTAGVDSIYFELADGTVNAILDSTGGGASDHGGLTGLTDDDHTQYALLAGRSGGQTLKGGTASGDDLILWSTNDATKGDIFFGANWRLDEANNELRSSSTDMGSYGFQFGGYGIVGYAATDAEFVVTNASSTTGSASVILTQFNGTEIGRFRGYDASNVNTWAGISLASAFRMQSTFPGDLFITTNTSRIFLAPNNTTPAMTVLGTGRIGFNGITTPTAWAHLGAGTTTTAPLKFSSGTSLTTPEAGAQEYDGTDFFATNSTTIRGRIAVWRPLVTSAGTLSVATTYSDLVFTGSTTTWTLPAISGNSGVKYFIKNRGSGDITINSNAGGNDIYSTSAVSTVTVAAGASIILFNDGTYWLQE